MREGLSKDEINTTTKYIGEKWHLPWEFRFFSVGIFVLSKRYLPGRHKLKEKSVEHSTYPKKIWLKAVALHTALKNSKTTSRALETEAAASFWKPHFHPLDGPLLGTSSHQISFRAFYQSGRLFLGPGSKQTPARQPATPPRHRAAVVQRLEPRTVQNARRALFRGGWVCALTPFARASPPLARAGASCQYSHSR